MLHFIGTLGHELATALAGWRRRQRAYAELYALDDRSLADIGITRSEIPYVLSRAAATHNPVSAETPAESNFRHAA
jgi:uncharacterized protein YjiS (DUF1127 family)